MDTASLIPNDKLQPSFILKTRRNHGLEHATLHMLTRRFPRRRLAGHSDPGGFWIVGEIETDDLSQAVMEALQRLRSGEAGLAIHPNCGTNLVASSVLAGLAGVLATQGTNNRFREKLDRLPLAISLVSLALILARPLGPVLQARVTTSGDPGNLQIVDIRKEQRGRVTAHRVVTRFPM
jgi:hypothetical protein